MARAVRWLTTFAFTLVGAVTLIGNRTTAAGNDAVFTQSLVERAARFGGTYYQNGISPKGPLEDVAHDLAFRIGGYDGHFYVISIMVAISAALIGAAAARTAMITGANRHVALAVAGVVFVHFTLSTSAYAGLLYSRNIMVTLLAVAWVLTIDDRGWTASPRVQLLVAIATGALLGLAVQTIIPSVLDATSIGLAAIVLLSTRVHNRHRRAILRRSMALAAFGALMSAPAWYFLRGSFAEFWASWWTYASWQHSGIGLSFGQEMTRGWNYAYDYYQHRPLMFLTILAFATVTFAKWPRLDRKTRVMHLALLGWFVGGWVQLVTGERYSPHYFSVIAAPSAMIAAALAGHAFIAISGWPRMTRTTVAWPLLALLLSLYLSVGTTARLIDASSITSRFTSAPRDEQVERASQLEPERSVQAVLDLVSRDRDPLLAYSDDQFLYRSYRRIPATRFQQRYFLIGSIYLGQSSQKYILHDTWKWFGADLRQANPAAFLETDPVDSKPFARYVAAHFETAFKSSAGTVKLRNDVADSVLRGATTRAWSLQAAPTRDSGWSVRGNSADFTDHSASTTNEPLVLATNGCERIDGTLRSTRGEPAKVVFHFEDPNVRAGDAIGAAAQTISTGARGALAFSLVVGHAAAALVTDGRIVDAVAIPDHVRITVEPTQARLEVSDLRIGPAPLGGGC